MPSTGATTSVGAVTLKYNTLDLRGQKEHFFKKIKLFQEEKPPVQSSLALG
jgi:hypothetical protein